MTPFNRTILELKQQMCSPTSMPVFPFNRTILELKHLNVVEAFAQFVAFNRTILELKHNKTPANKIAPPIF